MRCLIMRNPNQNVLSEAGLANSSTGIIPGSTTTRNGVTMTRNSDGTVSYGGTRTGDPALVFLGPKTGSWATAALLPAGTYNFHWWRSALTTAIIQAWYYDEDGTYLSGFTISPRTETALSGVFTHTFAQSVRIAVGCNLSTADNNVYVAPANIGVTITPVEIDHLDHYEPVYRVWSKAYLGSTEINQINLGATQVFPATN